jgi:hypothetical protein
MFGMSREQLLGFVRHIITFVGGMLVTRGKLDEGQLEAISGVIITIVGLIFSFSAPEKASAASGGGTSSAVGTMKPPGA